jgi:hypothetical protein
VNTFTSSELKINAREAIRCEQGTDTISGKSIIRLLRLKQNAAGNLRRAGPFFELAEKHLPGVIDMLQQIAGVA